MTVRFCRSCGATSAETAFPAKLPGQLAPKLCLDCDTLATAARGGPRPVHRVITRAAYRAGVRERARSGQGDLVDLIVPPP